MSRSSRQRDSLTPSLFPFLAVLLCTMGALVLILMLVVSGAQASALQIAEQSVEQAEQVESQLKLASHGFQKQLTAAQIELEKKRLGLQHLENHIQELLTELEQLRRTAELADADEKSDEENQQAQAEAISELEKQLLEAHDKLKHKLDKPDGDKPIFAIIPYDGPNGTHRRPIYLECTEQGIRIQPEGVLLQVSDLEPPYGPGNPLDAALRTIRAQYAPANHAVTSTAYPLLVVRPSGIRTYAMARAAMSGWDDQFGYELVGEEVDLAFPEGDPGLANKIAQALALARERQAALIVAMPQKYRGFSERDRPLSGGSGSAANDEYGSDSQGSGAYPAEQYGSGSYAGNSMAQAAYGADTPSAGGRGGWANESIDGLSSSSGGDDLQRQPSADDRSRSGDSLMGFSGPAASSEAGDSETLAAGDSFFGTAGGPNNPANGSYGPGKSYGSSDGSSRRETGGTLSTGLSSGGTSSDGLTAAGNPGSPDGRQSASGNSASGNSSADSPSAGTGSSASGGAAGGASGGSQMTGQPTSGSQMSMPITPPSQSDGGSQSGASEGSTSTAGNTSGGTQRSSAGSTPPSPDDNSDQQAMPQLSLDKTFNGQKQESTTPVASRRGRGWAWSQGPRTQTPVGRSIRMLCLQDRWIILPDSGKANDPAAITIAFDSTPQQRAEKLARVVAERVDSWGLALTGGYWKPILLVDVGPDAEWRFNQLQQLLEASGLEVQRGK